MTREGILQMSRPDTWVAWASAAVVVVVVVRERGRKCGRQSVLRGRLGRAEFSGTGKRGGGRSKHDSRRLLCHVLS